MADNEAIRPFVSYRSRNVRPLTLLQNESHGSFIGPSQFLHCEILL